MNSIGLARKRMIEEKNQQVLGELNYKGNVGIAEVFQFYTKAKEKGDHALIKEIDNLIARNDTKTAWKIILDYLGTSLSGKNK